MLVLTVLGKINYTRLKFCQGGVTVFLKDSELLKARVKLINTQLNKLNYGTKRRLEQH